MVTRTAIANLALSCLGSYRINDYSDDSREAVAVRVIYDQVKAETFAAAPWDFATKQATLARTAATPTARYDYAYTKPTNWMRSIVLADNADFNPVLTKYRDIGGEILTNAESVYMEYVSGALEEAAFPPHFVRALQFMLAMELAKTISSSETQRQQLREMAKEARVTAFTLEAVNSAPISIPASSWATSRRA